MNASVLRRQGVFGTADGVTIALGLIVSLSGQPAALVHAAVGAGLAELAGMTAGAWISDPGAGFLPAIANGGAALAGCLIPTIPYLALHGWPALTASMVLICAVAAVVSWLRPVKGVLAVAQTYGVLFAAAVLCFAASLI